MVITTISHHSSLPNLHTPPRISLRCNNSSSNDSSSSTFLDNKKHVSVDYDQGKHHATTHLTGFRKDDIPKRYRLRVIGDRFEKDWTLSEVVEKVYQLRRWEDIDGVLNHWVGRFSRKNFPLLIKEMTRRGSLEHCKEVFRWMKNQRNYCARTDIYNMMIRLYARNHQIDQARGLFFEMQEWRCKPDAETYNALINAHGRLGQWRWAKNIMEDMLRAAVCICILLP
uniref:Pentatricopeptide repeat-containing protein n=1 Tax=Cannabis sativa TaxID=3483 RepID=A0A803R141_CANSA